MHGMTHGLMLTVYTDFMLAAIVSPLTAELADVVRNVNGIGCKSWYYGTITCWLADLYYEDGHVYGFFNMAFGVGSAGTSCSLV